MNLPQTGSAPHVVACLDDSAFAPSVCDHAAWAAGRLQAPLTFLHVIDHRHAAAGGDLSGSIGFGAQEDLLEKFAALDEQKGRLAMERGRRLLAAAHARARDAGLPEPASRQVHGQLVETLAELEPALRLLVLGKRGETAHLAQEHLGSNLERVIRAVHRPILVVPAEFRRPERILMAFDGSPTAHRSIVTLAGNPLVQGLRAHVVMAGDDTPAHRIALQQAADTLEAGGVPATTALLHGEPEVVLTAYEREHAIDLVVMGAYGHSRIRQLVVGSTTTAMLRATTVALLILR